MKKVMAGVVALATALALAGCASKTTYQDGELTIPADPFTLGDALGLTGAVLLIPVVAGVIVFFCVGVEYEYGSERTDKQRRIGLLSLIGAGLVLGVVVLLWIIAIWSGVGR